MLPADHPLLVGAPPHEPAGHDLIERADFVLVIGSDLDAHEHDGLAAPAARSVGSRSTSIRADATKNYVDGRRPRSRRRAASPRSLADATPASRRRGRATRRDRSSSCATSSAADPTIAPTPSSSSNARAAALPDDAVVFADMCIAGLLARRASYPVADARGRSTTRWAGARSATRSRPRSARPPRSGREPTRRRGRRRRRHAVRDRRARDRRAGTAPAHRPSSSTTVATGCCASATMCDPDLGCELRHADFAAVARGFGIAAQHVDGLGERLRGRARPRPSRRRAPNLLHVARHARAHPAHLAALAPPSERESADGLPSHLRHPEADDDEMHAAYDRGIEIARSWLGEDHHFTRRRRAPPWHARHRVRGALTERPRRR